MGFPVLKKETTFFMAIFAKKEHHQSMTEKTYITSYIKNEKVVDQVYPLSLEEVRTVEAMGRAKGCEVETIILQNNCMKSGNVVVEDVHQPDSPKPQKRPWNKWIQCVETGEVFPSVSDCCDHLGLSYKSVWNAINNGKGRCGLHFEFVKDRLDSFKNLKKKPGTPSRKVICITTGKSFESVRECLNEYHFPANSFYRALNAKKAIRGMMFEYL